MKSEGWLMRSCGRMRFLKSHLLVLVLTVLSPFFYYPSAPAYAQASRVMNSEFAIGIAGIKPVTISEYQPIYDDRLRCLEDGVQDQPPCPEIGKRLSQIVYEGFLHAAIVSQTRDGGPYFCANSLLDAVQENDTRKVTMVTMLVLGNWLERGSSLYGDNLSETYVAKVVFDALVGQYPCN
jgi:hypothetical protein